jgi:regulator of sigma E protease
MIDAVTPGSVAAKANLTAQEEIVAFNHQPISSWRDFQYALMPLMGTAESVPVTVKSMVTGKQSVQMLPLSEWKYDGKTPDVLATLGIKPFVPTIPPVVGTVVDNSAAAAAGFKVGDKIISVDGVAITDWLSLMDLIQKNPGKVMSIVVKREGSEIGLPVTIGKAEREGHNVGLLGIQSKRMNWPPGWLRTHREGPIKALKDAFRQTIELTTASFSMIGRLATGKISLQGVSGPIGIAQGAGESARGGFSYYVSFLALISISLGVLNLLPIPLLDGGHLLYYFMELIRRRPLSPEFKSVGMYLGLTFLIAMMVLALSNDIGRLTNGYK